MNTVSSFDQVVFLGVNNILANIFGFLPNLLAASTIFIVGLLLAGWAKILTVNILSTIKLSSALKKSGLEVFLKKAEIKAKIEEILGKIVQWLIILVFFIAAVNILGLTTVSAVLNDILNYIPKVLSAVLILTAGVLLAGLVESVIKSTLAQIDGRASRVLAKLGSYILVIFAALTAISELGIAKDFINTLFIGVVAMLALGLGLAIGLGAKDLVARILNEWYEDLRGRKK